MTCVDSVFVSQRVTLTRLAHKHKFEHHYKQLMMEETQPLNLKCSDHCRREETGSGLLPGENDVRRVSC